MIWKPWLTQLRDLPASECEWACLPAFLEAVKQIADEKRKKREENWQPLRQALADLQKEPYTQEISYFELSCDTWSAEACSLTEAKGVAEQVNEFETLLHQHAKLRHQTCQTRTEELQRRDALGALSEQTLKLHATLTPSLTKVDIYNLLRFSLKNKDWAEADQLIEQALSAPIADAFVLRQIGNYYRRCYKDEGDPEILQEGYKTFHQLLKVGRNRPAALTQLAYFHDVLGDPEEADECLQKAIIESEMDVTIIGLVAWFYNGYLKTEKGEDPSERVKKLFDAVLTDVDLLPFAKEHIVAIKSNLENGKSRNKGFFIWPNWVYRIFSDLESQGDTFNAKGQEEHAQECFQVALEYNEILIEMGPKFLINHSNRIKIYSKIGNPIKAQEHAIKAIDLCYPDIESIGRNYQLIKDALSASIEDTEVLTQIQSYYRTHCQKLIKDALSAPIEDIEVFTWVRNYYEKFDQMEGNRNILEEGLAIFRQLLDTGQNRPVVLVQLTYFYTIFNDQEKADECARKAIVESQMDVAIIAVVHRFYNSYLKNQKDTDSSKRVEELFNALLANVELLPFAEEHITVIKLNPEKSKNTGFLLWPRWLYRIFSDLESRGDMFHAEGKEEDAHKCYQIALEYNEVLIEMRPKLVINHANRLRICEKMGIVTDTSEVQKRLRRLPDVMNNGDLDLSVLEEKVRFHIQQHDYEKADECNDVLLYLDATDKVYLTNKGRILIAQGSEKEAQAVFIDLASKDDPVAHYYLGKISMNRGDLDTALEYFQVSYDLGGGLERIKSILLQGGQSVRENMIHRLTESNIFHEDLIPVMEGVLTDGNLYLKLQTAKYFMRYTIHRYFYDESKADFEQYLRRLFFLFSDSCRQVDDYSKVLVEYFASEKGAYAEFFMWKIQSKIDHVMERIDVLSHSNWHDKQELQDLVMDIRTLLGEDTIEEVETNYSAQESKNIVDVVKETVYLLIGESVDTTFSYEIDDQLSDGKETQVSICQTVEDIITEVVANYFEKISRLSYDGGEVSVGLYQSDCGLDVSITYKLPKQEDSDEEVDAIREDLNQFLNSQPTQPHLKIDWSLRDGVYKIHLRIEDTSTDNLDEFLQYMQQTYNNFDSLHKDKDYWTMSIQLFPKSIYNIGGEDHRACLVSYTLRQLDTLFAFCKQPFLLSLASPLHAIKTRLHELSEDGINIENIEERIAEIKEICNNFEKYAVGFRFPKIDTFSLEEVLSDICKRCNETYNSNQIFFRLGFDIGNSSEIEGNQSQITECFYNLGKNATEAIAEKRKQLDEVGKKEEVCFNLIDSGEFYSILCQDTGIGATPEQLEEIFNVEKSNKATGSGLGLKMGRRIIKTHAGSINATSRGIGHGMCFEITLPKKQTD